MTETPDLLYRPSPSFERPPSGAGRNAPAGWEVTLGTERPTYAVTTLGCRLNQAESDAMADALTKGGLRPAGAEGSPDIVVINTCTVTREATKASRSAIRRAVRSHPGAKIVVAGCYVVADRVEVEAIEGVDVALTNDDKDRFVEALGMSVPAGPLLQVGMRAPVSSRPASARPTPARGAEGARVRANLKAQTGCDEWCSFCIIPKTRGRLRSYGVDALVNEARARVEEGAREIVLTGVHLGKYGYDSGGNERDLIHLFERLLDIDGLWRLRLSSILSDHLTDEVLGFMAAEPRMCRHLHVPLQSGSDPVLEAMHRPYRVAAYLERVEAAKAALPGVALATDVIVGFPGETERDFRSTLDVVGRVGFTKLHVFRYSPRPGTAAGSVPDRVPPEVKKDRSRRLIALGKDLRASFLASHLNRPLKVLVEDERVVDGLSICSGQTDDWVRVWFEGRGLLGTMVSVTPAEVRADGLRARVTEVAGG